MIKRSRSGVSWTLAITTLITSGERCVFYITFHRNKAAFLRTLHQEVEPISYGCIRLSRCVEVDRFVIIYMLFSTRVCPTWILSPFSSFYVDELQVYREISKFV
jgi:hypothetical protein